MDDECNSENSDTIDAASVDMPPSMASDDTGIDEDEEEEKAAMLVDTEEES